MKRYTDDPCALVLQTQDESFNECNTPVLANGTEPGFDMMPVTPMFERIALELLALIADEIFRSNTCVVDGAFKKVLNRYRCRRVLECGNTHDTSRIVIDDHGHPPAERSALG